MSIIVSNYQHCDEQQLQTLSCVLCSLHYTIFSVVKLDLFIRARLLDRILALEITTRTPPVYLVSNCKYFFTAVTHITMRYESWKSDMVVGKAIC